MVALQWINMLPRLAWLALLLAASALAVTFSVGGDEDCSFSSIQSAIDALPDPGPHEIRIANSQDYSAQAIKIVSLVVTLRGGFAHCADATSSGGSVLSGQGGGQDSVLTITGTGNDVILEHISLIRGDEVYDGDGGGIDFRGAGYLTLRNVSVYDNYAGYGGGISVAATGGAAELRLEGTSWVWYNTAQFSGGGIRMEGAARMFMLQANSQLFSNKAIGIDPTNNQPLYGYGGGIEVIGPARADLSGFISDNTARYGGGIAVIGAGDDGDPYLAIVRLFTSDANKPVRISDNRASHAGGGIWLKPNFGFNDLSPAILCAYEFRIDGNHAQQGSAIYADTDASSSGKHHDSRQRYWRGHRVVSSRRLCAARRDPLAAGQNVIVAVGRHSGGRVRGHQ